TRACRRQRFNERLALHSAEIAQPLDSCLKILSLHGILASDKPSVSKVSQHLGRTEPSELPIEGDLDINGWDIQKALGLLLKPNPVLLEWLSSPVRYHWNEKVCDQLISLSKGIAHNRACLHHYIGVGEGSFARTIAGKDAVSIKKYFYVLRPAMALRWVRMHPDAIPPMNFQELMRGVDLPNDLTRLIGELLEKKRVTKEMGEAPRIKELDDFAITEFAQAKAVAPDAIKPDRQNKTAADELFRSIVKGDAGGSSVTQSDPQNSETVK
ncbi:MAG: hypothetical protein CBC34_018025, partial [Hyphomicrobiaceae bacterium TMED74]